MNIKNTEIDRYRIFYVEAVMSDSAFPEIGKIKPLFENISFDEFYKLLSDVFETGDYEIAQQFLYFLMLFRDMEHIQEYMNSSEFSITFLEKFIIFTYGYCTINGHSTERVIDEILYFLSNDKLLELVVSSRFVFNDKVLLFFIISRFDIDMLNRYFMIIEDMDSFINSFVKLPDYFLRAIISRNYHLFRYVMEMVSGRRDSFDIPDDFFDKFRNDIEQFGRIGDILKRYRTVSEKFSSDQDLPFYQRDMKRISFLVNMVKDLPDPVRAVEYFFRRKCFRR